MSDFNQIPPMKRAKVPIRILNNHGEYPRSYRIITHPFPSGYLSNFVIRGNHESLSLRSVQPSPLTTGAMVLVSDTKEFSVVTWTTFALVKDWNVRTETRFNTTKTGADPNTTSIAYALNGPGVLQQQRIHQEDRERDTDSIREDPKRCEEVRIAC